MGCPCRNRNKPQETSVNLTLEQVENKAREERDRAAREAVTASSQSR